MEERKTAFGLTGYLPHQTRALRRLPPGATLTVEQAQTRCEVLVDRALRAAVRWSALGFIAWLAWRSVKGAL